MHTSFLKDIPEYREEFEKMLDGNCKYELESLYCFGMQFVEDYLMAAIVVGDFI